MKRLGAVLLVAFAGCRPFDDAYDDALARLDAGASAGGRGGGSAAGGTAAGGSAAGGTAAGGSAAGGSTAGGSAAGGSTAGGSAAGGSAAGGSAAGGSAAGGSAAGGSTAGGNTAGGSTAGGSTAGGDAGGSAGGSAGGAAPCLTGLCVDEAIERGFGPNTSVRTLSATVDGGVVAGLFRSALLSRLLWREADGGWSARDVAGTTNRDDVRHLHAWSRELVAIADASGPNVNTSTSMGDTPTTRDVCGQNWTTYSAAMANPDEAWFGGSYGKACGWQRGTGFTQLDLSGVTGVDMTSGGQSTQYEGAWVQPDRRRFFAGHFATAIAELADGGWAVSRLNATQFSPYYTAMRGADGLIFTAGQQGIWARWDEANAAWVTGTSDTSFQFQDVWVERNDTAWLVGQKGTTTTLNESFIARFDGDAGFTELPLTFPPSVQLVSITGTGAAIYVGGRDRVTDGGTAGMVVLDRLRR